MEPVWKYGRRRPGDVEHLSMTEIGNPPGHRMGWKTRRNMLDTRNTIWKMPYCSCKWSDIVWHATNRGRDAAYNDHINEVKEQMRLPW